MSNVVAKDLTTRHVLLVKGSSLNVEHTSRHGKKRHGKICLPYYMPYYMPSLSRMELVAYQFCVPLARHASLH